MTLRIGGEEYGSAATVQRLHRGRSSLNIMKKVSLGKFFDFTEVSRYYCRLFKKADKKEDLNLRMMHRINAIAITMFLVAILVIVIRSLLRWISG